jgi:hypothetical protein
MAQFRKDTNQYLPQEKTIFEVVMLADQYGNVIGPANPSGMAVDAFGRARVSNPVTLFDSFHRYQDNGKLSTANSAIGSTYSHDANSSSILLNVTTANNSYVYRESNKVFAYQPGKSLQVLQTFVMAPAQTGLRQRYGYFGADNGFFLEQDGHNVYFVRRSKSTGTVVETRVAQADWNHDTLDGSNVGGWTQSPGSQVNSNPSGLTLDLSKAQILFHDIEWLGVGSVRMGFVINGQLIHCHTWHHANLANTTYMTTACLPLRCEIQNTANTGNASSLRVICSTVISEGGYQLVGNPKAVGQLPNTSYTLATAGVFYPVAAIRLKSEKADAIVIPTNFSVLGLTGNGTRIAYRLMKGDVTGGTWVDYGSDSAVQYNLTGTGVSNTTTFVNGYGYVAQQGSGPGTLNANDFRLQLERNSFTGTNTAVILAVAGYGNNDTCIGSLDWEEIN